jgi:NarL family two-component system response regulator LiaR
MLVKMNKIRVLVVDDHPLICQAVRVILENQSDFEIIGEASNGIEAVKLAAELLPDILTMDISMPLLNGLEATRKIKEINPNIKILVLTVHSDKTHLLEILEAGADGYLVKTVLGIEIAHAIRLIMSGESVVSTQMFKELVKHAIKYPIKAVTTVSGEKLSIRELEVLKLAAKGMSNQEMASQLNLGIPTIKSHLVEIYSKLQAGSRTEAIVIGLRNGFLTLNDLE